MSGTHLGPPGCRHSASWSQALPEARAPRLRSALGPGRVVRRLTRPLSGLPCSFSCPPSGAHTWVSGQGPRARHVRAGRVLREEGAALRTPCSPAHERALVARQAQVLVVVAVSLTLKAEPSWRPALPGPRPRKAVGSILASLSGGLFSLFPGSSSWSFRPRLPHSHGRRSWVQCSCLCLSR